MESRERYKYTPGIEKLAAFDNFSNAERSIDAQKSIYTENEVGYDINIPQNRICEGIVTINMRYEPGQNYKIENSLKLAANSSLRMIIYHHSTLNAKIKDRLRVEAAQGSRLEIVVLTDTRSLILSDFTLLLRKHSNVKITTLDINNAQVIRNQHIELSEAGAECSINGLYLTGLEEHVDNYVKIDHSTPHCTSNQLFKGVLSGRSTAAFTGHIFVARDAQQTAAYQQNHNILLTDTARVNTRPQLEIYADDVKCNHGATVGRLDPEAIYYMRQRGIPTEAARRLQLTGFAEDVVMLGDFEELQTIVHQKIIQKLASI